MSGRAAVRGACGASHQHAARLAAYAAYHMRRAVPCGPGGTLADYVPFYFTPFTPMLYNIKTGFQGVQKRPMQDILILVSSLPHLSKLVIPFVFTDRHAYLRTAQFSTDMENLDWIIWETLQQKDFRKDDIEKFEKYQAEALVHNHVPLEALLGIVAYNEQVKSWVEDEIAKRGVSIKVVAKNGWFL